MNNKSYIAFWLASTFLISLLFRYNIVFSYERPEDREFFINGSALIVRTPVYEPKIDARELIIEKAREYGVSPSIMLKIAKCESNFIHEIDGEVLRGKVTPMDTGIMQISRTYWEKKSKELGFNIYDLEDNIELAMWIAKHHGYHMWVCNDMI